jgi:hypothetical protein
MSDPRIMYADASDTATFCTHTEVNINLTPQIIAELFLNLSSQQQALFFNHCHQVVTDKWPDGVCGFASQMAFVELEKHGLTVGGRTIQKLISGDY